MRASGGLPTTIGFTGQRRDGTGLLFYNARYYDPGIGRFVSADDIGVDRANPQSRNRYSYVTNNPTKYTDASGHCGTNARASEYEEEEDAYCDRYISWLSGWGVAVHDFDLWMAWELRTVWDALNTMSARLGWGGDGQAFQRAMGGGVQLFRSLPWFCRCDAPGWEHGGKVYLSDKAFYRADDPSRRVDDGGRLTIVHEFAHRWDEVTRGNANLGLQKATGYEYRCDATGRRCARLPGDIDHAPSDYALTGGAIEDFAESVANFVYPGASDQARPGFRDSLRWNYVACLGQTYAYGPVSGHAGAATGCAGAARAGT